MLVDRRDKTGGLDRVRSIRSRVNRVTGRVRLTRIFKQVFFFFFQLQKQINDKLFSQNE